MHMAPLPCAIMQHERLVAVPLVLSQKPTIAVHIKN